MLLLKMFRFGTKIALLSFTQTTTQNTLVFYDLNSKRASHRNVTNQDDNSQSKNMIASLSTCVLCGSNSNTIFFMLNMKS